MATNEISFESVEQHLEKADVGKLTQRAAQITQQGPLAVLSQLCETYQLVRPILVLLSQASLIPKKWRDLLQLFIQVLDGVCPAPTS